MDERQRTFLANLVGASGPSGYEAAARAVWRDGIRDVASVQTDVHGSVIATVNPDGAPRVMLAGHLDEIGFMVSFVDDKGFISFAPIGGHDAIVLVGQRVVITTAQGIIPGVLGRKPIHLLKPDERKEVPEIRNLWIDIGAASQAEAEELVAIGDPITFAPNLQTLRGDLLSSKSFDNRIGAYVAAEAARAVAGGPLEAAVFAVGTCQEEIGLRGATTSAWRIKPDVAIAIDVGHALDYPELGSEQKQHGTSALGKGPLIGRGANINPAVYDLLVRTAKEENIPYQIEPTPSGSGTDAWAMQVAGQGIASAVVSIPLRYMHTPVEVLNTRDVDQVVALVAGFIRRLRRDTSFIVD